MPNSIGDKKQLPCKVFSGTHMQTLEFYDPLMAFAYEYEMNVLNEKYLALLKAQAELREALGDANEA